MRENARLLQAREATFLAASRLWFAPNLSYEARMPMDLAAVGSGCATILFNIGLLVVALMMVRKANATASYALAAGAGFRILTTCCVDFGGFGLRRTGHFELMEVMPTVFRIVSFLDLIVFWGAVVFAAVTLARAISAAALSGGARG